MIQNLRGQTFLFGRLRNDKGCDNIPNHMGRDTVSKQRLGQVADFLAQMTRRTGCAAPPYEQTRLFSRSDKGAMNLDVGCESSPNIWGDRPFIAIAILGLRWR